MDQRENANINRQPLKVYHLAHDLRGPLNSILGFSELLLEGIEGPINDIQAEDLSAIRQSAQNLFKLINDVVDLSKLDNNTLSFSFEAVSLEAVLNPILTNNPTLNEAEILIDSSETLLWGDSLRIQQMIKNLVRFAYAQNQGDPVNLNVTGNGTDVVFQLSATQAQLSADQMDVLFDLYVEIDEAGRSELGIGGLDLPLTQKLAEQHQGQVWAESNERGLTFFLKLPQQQPD